MNTIHARTIFLALLAALSGPAAAEVPTILPGEPEGLVRGIAEIATPRLQGMGLHGPWEGYDSTARATWYQGTARLQYGGADLRVVRLVPTYTLKGRGENRRWQQGADYKLQGMRGTLTIEVKKRRHGDNILQNLEENVRRNQPPSNTRKYVTGLDGPRELKQQQITTNPWRKYRSLQVRGEEAGLTTEGQAPLLQKHGRATKGPNSPKQWFYRVAAGNQLERAILQVQCDRPPFTLKIEMRNNEGNPEGESFAIKIAQIIIDAAREWAGVVAPRTAEPPPEVVEAPPPPPEPQPEPEPAPAPGPVVEREEEPPPVETTPPADDSEAEDWIEAMDAAMKGAEDKLQATLLIVRTATEIMKELKAELARLTRVMEADMKQVTDPVLRQRLLEHHREKLQALAKHHAGVESNRDRLAEETISLLAGIVGEVQQIYETHSFGELDFHAFGRVLIAQERKQFFDAQLALAKDDIDGALALGEQLKSTSATAPEGLQIEALARLQRGELVLALEAVRSARRQGYERTHSRFDEMEGSVMEVLEREIELKILRALQAEATRARAMAEGEFQAWVAAHERVAPGEDRTSAYWALHGAFWAGFSDITEGVLGAMPEFLVGETTAEARSRDVSVQSTDMARNHVGLSMIFSLRQKGLSLEEIGNLDTEGLRQAMAEHFGKTIEDDLELRRRLGVIKYAYRLDDMRALASGDPLVESDVLSRGLRIRIKEKGFWDEGISFASEAGNVFNGTMVAMTFAPMARATTSLRHQGFLGKAAAEEAFVGVSTVGEHFAASRPMAWATQRMAATRLGTAMLEGAKATHRFSSSGVVGGATTFMGEMALDFGASWAAGRYLGEEAQILYDIFSSLGGADSATWARSYERLVNARATARQVARNMRRTAHVAEQQMAHAEDFAARVRHVLEAADEAPLPAGTVQQLRRELAEKIDAPPEIISKIDNALELAEAGSHRGATQSLKDADNAGTVIKERAAAAKEAANDIDELAEALPPDATLSPRDAGEGTPIVVDQGAPPGTVIDPDATPSVRDGPGTNIDPDATPSVRDSSGTNVGADGGPPAAGSGAGTNVGAGNQPPPPSSGPPPTAPGSGAVSLRQSDEIWSEGDRLLKDDQFGHAADEYARRIEAGVDPRTEGILRQREDLARRTQAAAERRAARRDLHAADGTRTPPGADDDWLAEAKRAAKDNGLGDPVMSVTQPKPVLATSKEEILERATEISRRTGTPINEVYPAEMAKETAKAPAWVKPIKDGAGNPHSAAEVLGSRLQKKMNPDGPRPVSELTKIELNGREAPMLVTRRFEATTLGDHLDEVASSGHPDDVLAELMAYKGAVVEDMRFSILMGDGDRHFGNIHLGPDGDLFPADFGMSDINSTHYSYRYGDAPGNGNPEFYQVGGFENMPKVGTPEFKAFVEGPDFKTFVHGQMEAHFRYMILQQARTVDRFGREVSDTFFSSLRYEDFKDQIAKMRKALRDDVGSIVEQTMKDFKEIAPGVYKERSLDPEFTRKLLETRLDIMDEFFQTVDQRAANALKWARTDPWDIRARYGYLSPGYEQPFPLWYVLHPIFDDRLERIAA